MCVFQVSLWREERLEVMRVEGEVAARVREEEEARRREEEEREKRKRERDRAKVSIYKMWQALPPPTPDWHLLPSHLLAARYLPCRERLSMST